MASSHLSARRHACPHPTAPGCGKRENAMLPWQRGRCHIAERGKGGQRDGCFYTAAAASLWLVRLPEQKPQVSTDSVFHPGFNRLKPGPRPRRTIPETLQTGRSVGSPQSGPSSNVSPQNADTENRPWTGVRQDHAMTAQPSPLWSRLLHADQECLIDRQEGRERSV